MNVKDYYEENTRRFLRHGTGKGEYVIHRPVYGPGVETRTDAVHYAEDKMIRVFESHGIKSVVDLGCGVGGTMKFMQPRFSAVYRGVTLSPLQAEIGEELLKGSGCFIYAGDMTDSKVLRTVSENLEKPVAYICLEAYLHLPSTSRLFEQLSGFTRSGDIIIIQDDFLTDTGADGIDKAVSEFARGWQAANLDTDDAMLAAAEKGGFTVESNTDLTPFLGPKKLSNVLIALLVSILRPLKPRGGWWDNFSGGHALQTCLSRDLIRYRQIVLVRE